MFYRWMKVTVGLLMGVAVLVWAVRDPEDPGAGSPASGDFRISDLPAGGSGRPPAESGSAKVPPQGSQDPVSGSFEGRRPAGAVALGERARPARASDPLNLKREGPRIVSTTLPELRDRILFSSDLEGKVEALLEIASYWPEPGVRETLLQALEDPEAAVRMSTLEAFHIVKDLEAVPAIRDLSQRDPSPEVRQRGADLLKYLEVLAGVGGELP